MTWLLGDVDMFMQKLIKQNTKLLTLSNAKMLLEFWKQLQQYNQKIRGSISFWRKAQLR